MYILNRPVKILNSAKTDRSQPKYLQLVSTIRAAIKAGQFLPGDTLPSVKQLSDDQQLNRHTVMKSVAELIAEGWVESIQRVGYRVVAQLPIEGSLKQSKADSINQRSEVKELQYRIVRKGGVIPTYPTSNFEFNFAGGRPDMSLFPFAEFKGHMSDTLSRPALHQWGYGDIAGTQDLLEQAKIYLRKTRAIADKEIVITNGSQEAMYIAAQLLLKEGDRVAVEDLGYPPAMAAFKSTGAKLVGIKQDAKGILPDDLEDKILQGRIRLIYLTPLHQYPTTVTLTIGRRMQIYQLASRHQIPIIEDDYDHEFHYRCQPLAPMASQDPNQLVIYVATLSKIMFPGARIGFMAVSKSLANAVESYRMLINHKSNVLMQSAVANWMREGGFERYLRRTTRHYYKRRDHAVQLLNGIGLFEFAVPDGGMAIWLKIKDPKISAAELAGRARESDIFIQHEGEFHLHKSANQDRFIRLGFAGMSENEFRRGMEKLVGLITI